MVRGTDTPFGAEQWTQLHVTFKVDKDYSPGWSAYIHCDQEGVRFRADRFQLHEGDYVPEPPLIDSLPDSRPNLFQNASFENGTDPWFFTYRTQQNNLRRTFRRTSFALSRLLGNMGVAGTTPLIKRVSTPVGGSTGMSVVKNGNFNMDANNDNVPDHWSFSAGSKKASFQRDGQAVLLACPPATGDDKPSIMLAQHDVPVKKGQWYRISLRARAERLEAKSVTMTITNMANWRSFFEYQRFTPADTWQEFRFEVQANDSANEKTRLQIWYGGAGKLWLDDVRVTPISDPTEGRWHDGFYLDQPQEWDDPYRFFRW